MRMTVPYLMILMGATTTFGADSSEEVKRLTEAVETLTKRVGRLEAEIKELESQPQKFIFIPQDSLSGVKPGKDWLPREFQGRLFYIIPVKDDDKNPAEPKK